MKILAIDPGCIESAFVIADRKDLKPIEFGKIDNRLLLGNIQDRVFEYDELAIEMVESFGMGVGAEVFETVFWIGRFWEASLENKAAPLTKIYRHDEKLNLCGSVRAKDSNIRIALIDRFAQHDFKNGKGTKKNPDWFHGFAADVWSAYAVLVTYCDMNPIKEVKNND